MLIGCDNCHSLYDAASYKPGQRLRCRCGQIIVVPNEDSVEQRARTVAGLHCSHCGGLLEPGSHRCPYCNVILDPTSARLNAYCVHCYAWSPSGASYCSGCGKPLVEVAETPDESDRKCPRCKVFMRSRRLLNQAVLECPICCGMFVQGMVFEDLLDHKEQTAHLVTAPPSSMGALLEAERVSYIPCVICKEHMNRRMYATGSGVIIDYCKEHGYWLDSGELEKIARFVNSGGERVRYVLSDDEKRSGMHKQTVFAPTLGKQDRRRCHEGDTSKVTTEDILKFLTQLFDIL